MKLSIKEEPMWGAQIEDRPAALAEKLEALSETGISLEFVLARRAPEVPGRGVVFIAPIKGVKHQNAAKKAGFFRADSLHCIRVEGSDKAGVCTRLSRAVSEAGLNLRGFQANVIGRKFVAFLAFDDIDELRKAKRALKKIVS